MRCRVSAAFVLAALVALLLTGCVQVRSDEPVEAVKGPIRVGSKNFTESLLLSEIIMQQLQAAGFEVEDHLGQGGDASREELTGGRIDIYADYTANALVLYHPEVYEQLDRDLLRSPDVTYREAARIERRDSSIVWLEPAPANNTWGIAVHKTLASRERLVSLEDFASYVNNGGRVKLAGSSAFFERDDAFPAIEKAYGFDLAENQKVAIGSTESALFGEALSSGADGINAAMVYSTDGALETLGLVSLTDTKNAQLWYQPAPVLRLDTHTRYPEIGDILAPSFALLTTDVLRELNTKVNVDERDPGEVAREWLDDNGLSQ